MSDRRGVPPRCQLVPLTTRHLESRGASHRESGKDAAATGQQGQIILTLCRALLGDDEGAEQFHLPSECRAVSPPAQDRYR
jgi:hypothetical protein